jgi:hypothetical protein
LTLVLFVTSPAFAQPAKSPTRVLVYSLSSSDRWAPLAKDLTERIVIRVTDPAAQKGMAVISENDVSLMSQYIKERADLSEEDCRNAELCLSRVSQAADAHKLLSGRIDRLGDSFVGVLNLLDSEKAEREATRSCVAGSEEEFRTRMVEAASEMLGLSTGTSTTALLGPVPAYGRKIAVVPITGLEDQPGVAETLSGILSTEIGKYEYSVLTRGELLLLLRDARERREFETSPGSFDDILVPLAAAYGADYLATGHVAKFDQTFVILLKLIQISEAKVIRRIVEDYRGPIDHLVDATRFSTRRLFGREMSGTGALSIVTDVKGEYRVDRGGPEILPQIAPQTGLAAKKYELSISAPGFLSYSADVYIDSSSLEPLIFRPALEPIETEWYESPLFFGIAGTVAAGAAAAIVYALVPKGNDAGGRLE